MECKKIEDMMQLYVEDLCSEESKLWIESHVKECSECKKKLERLHPRLLCPFFPQVRKISRWQL